MGIFDPTNYQFVFLDYYFWSSVINAAAAFAGGVIVLNRHPSGRKNLSFFLLTMSVFAWALPYSLWQMAATEQVALFWTRSLMAGAIFIAIALLYFTLEILEITAARHRVTALVLFLIFEFFAFANLTPLFISHVEPALNFPFWPRPGPLFHPYVILWVLCFVYAAVLLFQGYRNSSGEVRQQRKLILVGLVLAGFSSSTNYFLTYDIPIAPFGNIVTSLYMLTITYAMLRYRLFEISPTLAAAAIVDALADPMFIVNTEHRISMVNDAASQLVDLPAASLKGKKLSTFLPCAHYIIGKLVDNEQGTLGSFSGDKIFLRTGGGKHVPISLSASRIPVKNKHGFVFICHNIAELEEKLAVISKQGVELTMKTEELEKANLELSASQESVLRALEDVEQEKVLAERERERSETILHSIGDGVFVVGRNGKLIMVNTAAERLVGSNDEQGIGRLYSEHFRLVLEGSSNQVDDFVAESMRSGRITRASRGTVLMTSGGQEIPVTVSSAPLADDRGVVFGAVAVIRDETKERKVDRAKTEFISVASHQLRTPLSSMKWLLEMLETTDQDKLNDQQKEYLALLRRSCGRMTKLVNELLNAYQTENGQIALNPRLTDLDILCRTAIDEVRLAATAKNLNLTMNTCELGSACIDPKLVCNALQNLLANAVIYTPDGGQVEVGGSRKNGEVVIFVKDSGIGVPEHQHEKIFRKFFRGDNVTLMDTDGAGLGLYVVKSIVESSGGRVWLESQEGQGSQFYISLPIGEDAAQDAEAPNKV